MTAVPPTMGIAQVLFGGVVLVLSARMLWKMRQQHGEVLRVIQAHEAQTFDDLELFLYVGGVAVAHAFIGVVGGIYDIAVILVFAQFLEFAMLIAVVTVLARWWRRFQ